MADRKPPTKSNFPPKKPGQGGRTKKPTQATKHPPKKPGEGRRGSGPKPAA